MVDKILERLDNINRNLEKIISVIGEPKSKFDQILEKMALIVSIVGVLFIIELIMRWVLGG